MTETYNSASAVPNPIAPSQAIFIDEEICIGCNTCANRCRMSLILPSRESGGPPIVMYPDECWFCGSCVKNCPTGAIRMEHPLNQRIGWKRKATGEYFRIGMKNPPPPNTRSPVG